MKNYSVPKATLGRLPVYLKYLKSVSETQKNISSTGIAKALGYGEVQVRKDLGAVSGKGKPKVGYVTSELIERLEKYLCQSSLRRAVIVGAGKLGRALLDYGGFSEFGLEIAAAFDINVSSEQITDGGKTVYPVEAFPEFCRRNDIRIGIITVPEHAAQSVCDMMVENSITAVWNFASGHLSAPDGVTVQQENLALSLAHLAKEI